MKQLSYAEAQAKLAEIGKQLTAASFGKYMVAVIASDGSVFTYRYAFVVSYGGWFLVFTEHHGYHIYGDDEQVFYYKLKRIPAWRDAQLVELKAQHDALLGPHKE
jgi:hypothetical protein